MIGVGVNTRMSLADLPVETATSFAASGLEVDEDRLLAAFLTELDAQLTALLAAGETPGPPASPPTSSRCAAPWGRTSMSRFPTAVTSSDAPTASMPRGASWSSRRRPDSRRGGRRRPRALTAGVAAAGVGGDPHNGSMTQPTTYGGRPPMVVPGAPTPELRIARFRRHARRA